MRDKNESDTHLRLNVHQLELRLFAQFFVEGAQGLVQQQHFGSANERARQRHSLPLAAGKLVGFAFCQRPELHHVQGIGNALAFDRRLKIHAPQAVANVFRNGHVREQGIRLKHHVDRTLVRGHVSHVDILNHDSARTWAFESCQHPQQGGFTAS